MSSLPYKPPRCRLRNRSCYIFDGELVVVQPKDKEKKKEKKKERQERRKEKIQTIQANAKKEKEAKAALYDAPEQENLKRREMFTGVRVPDVYVTESDWMRHTKMWGYIAKLENRAAEMQEKLTRKAKLEVQLQTERSKLEMQLKEMQSKLESLEEDFLDQQDLTQRQAQFTDFLQTKIDDMKALAEKAGIDKVTMKNITERKYGDKR